MEFIKPTIFKVLLFLAISFFIAPVFSESSLCLDLLAENSHDTVQPSYTTIPCVKLTTIPQHFNPVYITKNTITYQQNASYYYDLDTKYYGPVLNLFFAYLVSCGIMYCVHWLLRNVRKN